MGGNLLTNQTFKDGGLTDNGGRGGRGGGGGRVFNTLETMKYLTQNDCLIDIVMKYFEAEVINTNAET